MRIQMKLELTIDEIELDKKITESLEKYLDEHGLIPFIRSTVSNNIKQLKKNINYKDISERIKNLQSKVTYLEKEVKENNDNPMS